jgi:hypothetical protein
MSKTKLLIDHSFTPIEVSRMKYYRLLEEQILFKANKQEAKPKRFFNILKRTAI